jgi:hypothetical protein
MAAMVEGHARHVTTLLANGRLVIWSQGPDASAMVYDLMHGTWATTGSATDALSVDAALLLPDGTLLTIPGYDAERSAAAVEMTDPAVGTWTMTPTMIKPRDDASATLLADGTVLVAGGDADGTHIAMSELYQPDARP